MTDRAQRRDDLERRLSDAALAGAGAGELVAAVAEATGVACRLLTPAGDVVATSDDGPGAELRPGTDTGDAVTAADGWAATALVLTVGSDPRRVLLVGAPAGSPPVELAAGAGTALLIDAVRFTECAPGPTNPELRPGEVVSALRRGWATPHVVAAARTLRLLGDDPVEPAVLHYDGPRQRAWSTALAWLDHPVEHDGAHAWTFVRDAGQLSAVRTALAAGVGEDRLSAASGPPTREPELMVGAFAEAARLLAFVRRRGEPLLAYSSAGVLQVLLTTPRERLEQYVHDGIGPLLDKPELLQTLRAWLAGAGSRQTVSEQLHLHRNSVGYRVRRLKELLGGDPLEPATAARLHVALTAWDLLGAETPDARDRRTV